MTRTYPDSDILIKAFRGTPESMAKALSVLGDPDREFTASLFLRMETEAKARYNGRTIAL